MVQVICYNIALGTRQVMTEVEESLHAIAREAWAAQDSNTDHVYYTVIIVEEVVLAR